MEEVADHFFHVAHLAQCEFDKEFVFGLEIIIDGLEARLAR